MKLVRCTFRAASVLPSQRSADVRQCNEAHIHLSIRVPGQSTKGLGRIFVAVRRRQRKAHRNDAQRMVRYRITDAIAGRSHFKYDRDRVL